MFDKILASQLLVSLGILFLGLIFGVVLYHLNLIRTKSNSKSLIEKAEKEAERIKKDKLFNFREELQQKRLNFQKDQRQKEEKINRLESQLNQREKQIQRDNNQHTMTKTRLESKENKINELEELLFEKHRKLDTVIEEQNKKLERISHISEEDAKKMLLENLDAVDVNESNKQFPEAF